MRKRDMQATTTHTTFDARIPAGNIRDLREKIDHIAKRAKRLGVPAPTLTVHDETETEKVWIDGRSRDVVYVHVTVEGETPVVEGGWTFVATLQHEDGGTIIRSIASLVEEGELVAYRDADPNCDHCEVSRRRKDTFIVRAEDGTLAQVGRTCLQDYTGGHDPQAAARKAELLALAHDAIDVAGDVTRQRPILSTVEFLAWAVAVSREDGYVSKGRCYREGLPAGRATAVAAWDARWGYRGNKAERRRIFGFEEPSEADWAEAKRLAEKAEDILTERGDERNDYEHNLFISLGAGYVDRRLTGIVASVIGFIRRIEEREARERADREANHRHVGQPGDRLDEVVTVIGYHEFDGFYGLTTLVKLALADGARLLWFASGTPDIITVKWDPYRPETRAPDIGETFWATFTVKDHETDRRGGFPVTKVNRLSYGGTVEEFEALTGEPCPHCDAPSGVWCQTPKGGRASKLHKKRPTRQ